MILELNNISKQFFSLRGTISALKDISLDIQSGEFFVLLGPSGCGKSTLLNLIAGLEKPSKGQIKFDDKTFVDTESSIYTPPKQRNIAFVFQSYALYPHLNVYNNISFPLKIAGWTKQDIEKAVKQAADTLDISELLLAKPSELSGGQRQRVAIARAIVRKPNIFLLDEPLSNLDAKLRIAMRTEIKQLQRQLGITTVYVTHDQTEAMALGDRIAVLNQGKIEQVGSSQQLYHQPQSLFVAGFIGSPPMNLVKSSLISQDGRYFIVLGNQKIEINPETKARIDKLSSKDFLLAVRPEDIRFEPLNQQGTIKAEVESVECLGRENIAHLTVNGLKLTALASRDDIIKDRQVSISLDNQKLLFFNS